MKRSILFGIVILVVASIMGCFLFTGQDHNKVVIGGKNFTEQDILVYLMKGIIEDQTTIRVETRTYLGGTNVVAQAIERGDLDIYAEYTGTALLNILGETAAPRDPELVYEKVKNEYATKKQLIWLKPFGFNNTYTLSMGTEQAKALGIKTLSDLAKQSAQLKLGVTHEFLERMDGYGDVKAVYGMAFPSPISMEPGLTYGACRDGNVDVIDAFATDGRIVAFDLTVLIDDKNVFPPYYAAPIIRADTLAKHPEIADALQLLAGKLTNTEMSTLNAKVDLEGKSPASVANEWLIANKLI